MPEEVLKGRAALVTGVSRRKGIGLAIANPQGRWGEPEDAARLIGWLATDDAQWMTGQILNSNGGGY
jgi:NAD(P)-dependent dehydrogenase (short-subunit alcohol dehydrogenase family)